MAILPITYPPVQEKAIATYDFYDLSTGTGYKNFYLADITIGTNTRDYALTPNTIMAQYGHYARIDAAMDVDFDINIEVPMVLEGDSYLQIGIVGSALISPFIVTAKLYLVRGGETQIGSTVTTNLTVPANAWVGGAWKIPIPLTHFKRGDIFRISLSAPACGGGNTIWLLCDPLNRTDLLSGKTISISQSKILLPIRISS